MVDSNAVFLGVDVGSISTCVALIDARGRVLRAVYRRTQGRPVDPRGGRHGRRRVHRERKVPGLGPRGR